MKFEINILKGLDEIKFGITTTDVPAILGQPTETEQIDNGFGDSITVLHYDELNLIFFFDSETKQLNCIEVDNEEATLFGEKIFEKSEQEIVKLLVNNGFYEQDIETEAWGERRVSFGDANIDLFFLNGKLQSVTFGN